MSKLVQLTLMIERNILLIQGEKVMLDADLAELYDVETKRLVQAIKRNRDRFPEDFMFQLSQEEFSDVRSHFVTSSQGGRRYPPYAFTEQGIAMLSSVLRSKRAVAVNREVVRAFVRIRRMLDSNDQLRNKLEALEQQYDEQFSAVFKVMRRLMTLDAKKKPPIGFTPWPKPVAKKK